jgi:hypothetical protein
MSGMDNLEMAIEKFRFLSHSYGSVRQIRKDGYLEAQVELYHLAQFIGSHTCPAIQKDLERARRDAMEQLVKFEFDHLATADSIFAPAKCQNDRRWTWVDYQITPEVAGDPNLTGRIVTKDVTIRLQQALKAQVRAILRRVGM